MMEEEDIAIKLETHEQKIISVEHRVKDLEYFQKSQNELIISVNKLALNMEGMLSEQREQGERLKKLENEPAERWNSMQRTAFTTIVGVVVGALAAGVLNMIVQYMK